MKYWISVLLSILMIFTLAGCTKEEPIEVVEEELQEGNIYLYYINGSTYELEREQYTLQKNITPSDQVNTILKYMIDGNPGNQTNIMSSAITVIRYSYDEEHRMVRLNINSANELDDEYFVVLAKQAITKTLCQLDYVDAIQLEIYDSSNILEDTKYEIYDEASFVDAEEVGSFLQKGTITIYFANETGDMLLEYGKSVEITNNVSLEQIVVESLITGPLREGYGQTIPEGTTLKRISVKDGTCYVDLSGDFNMPLDTCKDYVTIYSLVNSLCELPTISKVQFLIDGQKQEFYRETYPMDGIFEFQEELVEEREEET